MEAPGGLCARLGVEGCVQEGMGPCWDMEVQDWWPAGVAQLSWLVRTGLGSPLLGDGWSSLEARSCELCPYWFILAFCRVL